MKRFSILLSAIMGTLAMGALSSAEAAPRVYQSAQGVGVLIDQCFVQFDHSGKLLKGGQKCDDIQLHDAKKAAQEYLRQHGGSASASQPKIYQSARGIGVLIDECFVQFDRSGNLLEGGQKCDDVQFHNAKEAARNYHGN